MSAQEQQQQQQQQHHQEPASTTTVQQEASRPAITADDNLSCQWDKCTERCTSAEALFVRLLSSSVTLSINQY
jgi:hypothetical protein